jgi:heat shock protein HslJ
LEKKNRHFALMLPLVLLAPVLLVACSVFGDAARSNFEADLTAEAELQNPVALEGTPWRLLSYIDGKGNQVDVLPGSQITALFEGGNLSGNAGCNEYNASYQLQEDKLTLGNAASTMKYCGTPEGVMEQEGAYLTALAQTATYKIVENRLQLLNADGKTILTYGIVK